MSEISFSYRGTPVALTGGQSFHRPLGTGFSDTGAHEMREIIAAVRSGTPWRNEIDRRFATSKPWLRDIILSPKRRAFFDLIPHDARRILDIGCGWGQMTLPLAHEGRDIAALEPGPHRLEFVEAAAEQDGVASKIAFIGADYFDCAFQTPFDAVLCIGVLEWIGAFHTHESPREVQHKFLAKVRRSLGTGGALIIGIENRIGAKYLLGCPDDHLGVPGVACLPAETARQRWKQTTGHELRCFTYSDFELRTMLTEAGFSNVSLHAAFPDYKLPDKIVSIANDGRAVNELLAQGSPSREHNGYDGSPLSAELLERLDAFYRDLARTGGAHHLVPSFFVVAR